MRWLVIGIGNSLRRDDGIGPWMAEQVEAWRLPDVTTRSVHQLTPELAADIAAAEAVLFLDASVSNERGLRPIVGVAEAAIGHALSLSALLALAARAGMRTQTAWLATVRANDLEFGEELSPAARDECECLLPVVRNLLSESARCMKSA